MAKVSGLFDFEGTINGITFYKTKFGRFARSKGGVSRKRIKKDPEFARSRENSEEFGNASTASKLLFRATSSFTKTSRDSRAFRRLMKIMTDIKDLDESSNRGKRNVGKGIAKPGAKNLLMSFNFNISAVLDTILKKKFLVDVAKGTVSIPDLSPKSDIVFPKGATHAVISAVFVGIDFKKGTSDLVFTQKQQLVLKEKSVNVLISADTIPADTGICLCLVKIEFLQVLNSMEYNLHNGANNALAIVMV